MTFGQVLETAFVGAALVVVLAYAHGMFGTDGRSASPPAGLGVAFAGRSPGKFSTITRAEFGAEWPLTVDEAVIGCVDGQEIFTTVIIVDGAAYALNGTTKAAARNGPMEMIIDAKPQAVLASDEPEDWWAKAESTPRKSLQPVFDAAEAMGCLLPAAMRKLRK